MATFVYDPAVRWPPPAGILLNYDTTAPTTGAVAEGVLEAKDFVGVDTHGGQRVVIVPPPEVLVDLTDRVTTIEAEQDTQDSQIAANATQITTNTANIATNAGAIANLPPPPPPSSTTPVMDGTAAAGVATAWARGDHVHPTDASRYAAANPAGYQTLAQVNAATTRINVVPAAPVCSVTASTVQSVVSGTPLKVKFDTVEYDATTAFDLVNNRFKPTVPGYYEVNFGCGLSAAVNTSYTSVYKNGAEYRRGVAGSNATSTRLSILVHLNGTSDYVEGFVTASAAASTSSSAVFTAFTAVLAQASAT